MNWTETTFDTGEVRLHVLEGPASGPPLVFLHGATGSHATWLRLAPHFAEYRRVFLLDLRGHNLSSRAGGPRGPNAEQRRRCDGQGPLWMCHE